MQHLKASCTVFHLWFYINVVPVILFAWSKTLSPHAYSQSTHVINETQSTSQPEEQYSVSFLRRNLISKKTLLHGHLIIKMCVADNNDNNYTKHN